MNISIRLKTVASLVHLCNSMADIGTDHGYIPIYLIKEGVCTEAIASDINKGPVQKAENNVKREGLESKITCRLGRGLTTIKPFEVDCAVIAGMGGNLIRDIIKESMDVFKSLKYAVLQPVQNPDILRRYLYESGYEIMDEELCIDEGKYYEIIKVRYDNKPKVLENIYYEVGEKLIHKKHPLLENYIDYKIEKYKSILSYINDDTEPARLRKADVENRVEKLKELILCL